MNELKKEIENHKKEIPKVLFEPSFNRIFELMDSSEVLINVPKYSIENHKAIITKNKAGGFLIELEGIISDMSEAYDIEILIENKIFLVSDLFISMRGSTLKRNNKNNLFSGKFTFLGEIHELIQSTNTNKELFNRFIIPTLNKSNLDFYIETTSYQDESTLSFIGRLPIIIDNQKLTLYEKKIRDRYYFIVDSDNPIKQEYFSDICHSIMIGFGFLSADFIQNEAYYLQSSNKNFDNVLCLSYLQLRPSIFSKGTCNPIYSNPYGYTKDEKIINTIGRTISVFDSTLFSRLCSKIFKEEDYATLILLILEANSSSLILKPAGYSVALEKITNIIVEENKGLKPIPDKQLAKEFRQKLNNILSEFKPRIEAVGNEDSLIILQKNIDKINNPTNRDKLIKPFSIYDIKLNEGDLNAIDNRNNFLHGRNIDIDKNSDEFLEIFQVSLRLNKIINKLILKHIGFSGIIINHLKYNESSFDMKIEEDLFEKI